MRNHGGSPHAPDMRYPALAEDVRDTLRALDIEKAAVVGHSMGGKAAMALALRWPQDVGRLLVSDIAPVSYEHGNEAIAEAMAAIPLTRVADPPGGRRRLGCGRSPPGYPRLPAAKPAFRRCTSLAYRPGGDRRGASRPGRVDRPPGSYAGPSVFVTGANSDYVLA